MRMSGVGFLLGAPEAAEGWFLGLVSEYQLVRSVQPLLDSLAYPQWQRSCLVSRVRRFDSDSQHQNAMTGTSLTQRAVRLTSLMGYRRTERFLLARDSAPILQKDLGAGLNSFRAPEIRYLSSCGRALSWYGKGDRFEPDR